MAERERERMRLKTGNRRSRVVINFAPFIIVENCSEFLSDSIVEVSCKIVLARVFFTTQNNHVLKIGK